MVVATSAEFLCLAQEAPRQLAERLSPMAEAGAVDVAEVFAGRDFDCRWLIREVPEGGSARVTLDIHQALTATTAPVETGLVLAEAVAPRPGQPVEVSHRFAVPASDRPIRYLLKLWLETKDKKTAAAVLLLHAAPPSLLEPLGGLTIEATGFDPGESWVATLRAAKVDVKFRGGGGADTEGDPEAIRFFFVKKGESKPALTEKLAKARRILYFFEEHPMAAPSVASVLAIQGGEKRRVEAGARLLRDLPDSPTAQRFLARIITEEIPTLESP